MTLTASTLSQSRAIPFSPADMTDPRRLLIIWNESLRTGINILDEQHRGLVAVINSLHAIQSMPDKKAFLKPTIEMIVAYTKVHFATEIALMEMSDYPLLHEHQAQHDDLIFRTKQSVHACMKECADPTHLVNHLKEWFLVHIVCEDKAYSSHLLAYFKTRHRVKNNLTNFNPRSRGAM